MLNSQKELSPRWRDKSARARSMAMRKLARIKHAQTSEHQKKLIARKLVNARGYWKDGMYIRRTV